MAKIVNLSQSITQLTFLTPHNEFNQYYQNFLDSHIGRIHQVIPWDELSGLFAPKRKTKQGRPPLFDIQGQLALMFLKSYTGYSDDKLIQRLNTDYSFQFFCGVYLRPDQQLRDSGIVSKIRCRLAQKLTSIDDFQQVLADHWRPYMEGLSVMMSDATCYETDMRYPTDVKLLWEACEWIYGQIKRINKQVKGRMPRSKFGEQKTKHLAYQKKRKKTYKETRRRQRSLLYLLNKLLGQLEEMETRLPAHITMPERFHRRRNIIRDVYQQQHQWYETGEPPKNRIVSLHKSYIRPIVRGKETKRVEFGAKVNQIQIDGINFIDHLSFEAFNEGTRLVPSIEQTVRLSGTECKLIAADAIYGTNANRKYCTTNGITTNFKRKGRAGKDEAQLKQIRSILSKERSTRMEGSFGTEKQHYSLDRIRARTEHTETLWIVIGIHTANAVRMTDKILGKKTKAPPGQTAAA